MGIFHFHFICFSHSLSLVWRRSLSFSVFFSWETSRHKWLIIEMYCLCLNRVFLSELAVHIHLIFRSLGVSLYGCSSVITMRFQAWVFGMSLMKCDFSSKKSETPLSKLYIGGVVFLLFSWFLSLSLLLSLTYFACVCQFSHCFWGIFFSSLEHLSVHQRRWHLQHTWIFGVFVIAQPKSKSSLSHFVKVWNLRHTSDCCIISVLTI
jgi:hypothetical protein